VFHILVIEHGTVDGLQSIFDVAQTDLCFRLDPEQAAQGRILFSSLIDENVDLGQGLLTTVQQDESTIIVRSGYS
jgi:hypothetical protein